MIRPSSVSATHPQFDLVVHATHEAGVKVGGIGSVLDGLLSTRAYNEHIARTILIGPMDTGDRTEMERLTAPRNRLEIRYSCHHGVDKVGAGLSNRLRTIEQQYNVKLFYGTRAFGSTRHEVILVDGRHAAPDRLNAYKASLYGHFGVRSDRYESHPEYNLHVNIAEPGYQALRAVVKGVEDRPSPCRASSTTREDRPSTREDRPSTREDRQQFIVAHEFMGLPLCYSAMMHAPGVYHTVFYGHEVTTVRPIVESHPGHDTMFYSVLEQAQKEGRYLEDVFGDQSGFFKHGLIHPAVTHCDNIFAVGDWVVKEMRFLDPDWEKANIDLVYNGVPSYEITLDEKKASRARLQRYCGNLLGYSPDHVFTHVTRFIPSKGLWRDIRVLEHLDSLLAQQNKSAVLFVLSTIIPVGRPAKAVFEMEASYGWPVIHRETSIHVDEQDVPDLIGHEIPFYRAIERFNQMAKASKIVLVNQFGWSQDRCGVRMPKDMTFVDIRQGSDLEFGQSIYEPFGIAQLEPLSFGALCVVSNICGCLGFVDRAGGQDKPNVIVADYTAVGALGESVEAALSIDQVRRDQIESTQAHIVAREIADRLPRDNTAACKLLQEGYALSQKMSWEVVARDYLLPGLARAGRQDSS